MCQKSHVIIFNYVFPHCWVPLLVLHLLKKEPDPLVILDSDFALLNQRRIALPKF